MKRMAVLLLSFLLILSLYGCSDANGIYTVDKEGKTFEVNSEDGTIFDGTHTYEYTFSGDSSSYRINITYPNGSSYYWNHSGYSGHGGWSDDYDESLYVSGDTLCDVIVSKAPDPSNPSKVVAIILLIAIGTFNAAAPGAAWHLEYGWRYKNAEPSDLALGLNRVGGIAAIIVGVLMIFLRF